MKDLLPFMGKSKANMWTESVTSWAVVGPKDGRTHLAFHLKQATQRERELIAALGLARHPADRIWRAGELEPLRGLLDEQAEDHCVR